MVYFLMCGIAGLINTNNAPVSHEVLKKMTDAIAYRGPDGEGQWVEGNVGIGHRRLAIIDLSSYGLQPMMSSDERFILSFNGEIYNFLELRTELQAVGYCFRSSTDSEVVLSAIEHWGTDAFLKFNGMFAIAAWDRKKKKLLLARDRYGVKPLYYAQQGHCLSFASEQKAITSQSTFKRKLNKPALREYLTFQNILTSQTLLEDIHLLPAGCYAEFYLGSSKIEIKQYWDYKFCEPDYKASKKEYIEELDRLFHNSVKRQMLGEVEIGSYLSGGIDSTSIATVLAKLSLKLKTFTCGFDLSSAEGIELAFDERDQAKAMSSLLETDHYETAVKSGDMESCMSKLVWHLEEPRVGQSYPNYYAAKLASKHVKVVLSGSGGDELFGGYPWRYYSSATAKNFKDYIKNYYNYWQRLATNTELEKMFAPVHKEVSHVRTQDIFENVFSSHDNALDRPADFINHSLYFESKTFLQGLFLVEDKISMAHSLESRVPFMDNKLVDFAMQCPAELKLNNLTEIMKMDENENGNKKAKYFDKTNDGKKILREMMSRYIPETITSAKKQGFSSPDASWFKGESIDFVKRALFNSDARIYSVLDRNTVVNMVNQHLNGERNRRLLIWSLLYLETYLIQNGL